MDRGLLLQQLKVDEGFRSKPYLDTEGINTVGYGRNLDHVGITEDEAEHMLMNDIDRVSLQLETLPVYRALDEIRQTVIANMTFNLGFRGVLSFRKMWAALAEDDYIQAAQEMKHSKWFRQVGPRAQRLITIMQTGAIQ
jgi:lysozyme